MRYVDIALCRAKVFPFIHAYLSEAETAPNYEEEVLGMEQLEKVLTLVRQDEYYPRFADKAAYLLCGLAGAQYFSNGNKRLGVAVLVQFLVLNSARTVPLKEEQYRTMLARYFPDHAWERNTSIRGAHALFLYNIALVIGDRNRWGAPDFASLKERVTEVFAYLYRAP